MAYNLSISDEADIDLEEAVAYVAKDSKRYATELYKKIVHAAESLTFMPLRGTHRDDLVKDCRILVVGTYLLVYKVEDKTVSIVRILHQSQNAHNMFE